MVSRMDKMVMSAENRKTVDPSGELLQLPVLADGGDLGHVHSQSHIPPQQWKRKSTLRIHSMLKWKRHQDEKHEMFMVMIRKLEETDKKLFRKQMLQRKQSQSRIHPGEFLIDTLPKETEENFRMSNTSEGDSSMDSMPDGDFMRSNGSEDEFRMGSTQEDGFKIRCVSGQRFPEKEVKSVSTKKGPKSISKKDKAAACRHFTKECCRQGEACSFLHSVKNSYPNNQKVFLGGLPHSITTSKLVEELGQQAYRVVNEPKIFRGFSPQVRIASSAEPMKMLQEGKITICGSNCC